MTLPIQLPQIGTTGVVPPQPNFLQQAVPILEAITQQKLAAAQMENYRSLAEERKAAIAKQARDLQDQADAAKAFYDHLSGAAVRLKPEKPSKEGVPSHQGVDETTGTLIPLPQFERGLNPGALVNYHSLLQDYNKTVLQRQSELSSQAETEHNKTLADIGQLKAIADRKAAADDVATQRILGQSDLTTDDGQRRAIRQVLQTVGPAQADKLARTLAVGQGRYQHLVANGQLYIIDSQTGKTRLDRSVGMKPDVQAAQRNAGLVVDLLDEQSKLIRDLGIGSSKNPSLAAVAEASRVLGVSTEGLSNWMRSDPEQLTRMLRTRFAHLYVGLLPHSRSAGQLLENLTESYWAPAGSGTPLLRRAERDRQSLRRILVDIRDGKTTDFSRLPGFSEAAAAAAAEGQSAIPGEGPVQGSTNPDDWVNGVPQ
jgi:hypothetical protein